MNIKKLFFKYTGLSMFSTIGMSCYVLADTLFIANGVGTLGLTALNLVLPIYNIIFGIGIMLGTGGATRFSIFMSQGQQKAKDYFFYAIVLGLCFSIPFVIIGLCFPETIVFLLGGNTEVLEMASLYLRTFIIFTPFFILNHIFVIFIRNDQNPTLASLAMFCGTLFNIIFDYIFIFPCQLGMFGAALATGCSPIVSLCICLLHFKKKDNHLSFQRHHICMPYVIDIIKIGIPAFITELSSGIITFAFNKVIFGIGGNIAIASYGIICNLAIVVISLYTGIAQGVQPLMSQCYGHHDVKGISYYLKYSLLLSLFISCLIYGIVCIYPDMIISFFNSEGNIKIIEMTRNGLILYFSGFFFAGLNIIYISYFTSTQKIQHSFIVSLLRGGVVIIPLVIIFSSLFSLSGVWISFPISEAMIFIIAYLFYKKYQFKV